MICASFAKASFDCVYHSLRFPHCQSRLSWKQNCSLVQGSFVSVFLFCPSLHFSTTFIIPPDMEKQSLYAASVIFLCIYLSVNISLCLSLCFFLVCVSSRVSMNAFLCAFWSIASEKLHGNGEIRSNFNKKCLRSLEVVFALIEKNLMR